MTADPDVAEGGPGFEEVPQYRWPTDQALAEGILEVDRALAVQMVGAMDGVMPVGKCTKTILSKCTMHGDSLLLLLVVL